MQKTAFHKRIPFRLSLILAAIIYILSSFAEIPVYYYTKNRILNAVNNIQLTRAKNVALDIEVKIKQKIHFISALSKLLTSVQLEDVGQLEASLQKYTSLVDSFSFGFSIIQPDGKCLIDECPAVFGRGGLAIGTLDWFKRAKQGNGVVISKPFRARNGDPMIIFATAIRGASGDLAGVVAAPILLDTPEFLGVAYAESKSPFSELVVLSRTDKMVVASANEGLVLRPIPEPGANLLLDRAMEGFTGVGMARDEFGAMGVVAFAGVPTPDWFVAVRTPAEIALAPVRDEMLKDFTATILLISVVVVTIFITLTIYFRPLAHAAKQVRTMGGDKALPHLPRIRDDEIGDLTEGFNSLVDAINERSRELSIANEQLEKLSRIDGLTKVFNRRWFDRSLNQCWRVCRRYARPMSIIFLDIDLFKKYNDSYGHLQGDECLVAVATALNRTLKRPMDIFARYGGEEFAAIVENDQAGAMKLAEVMRRTVEELALEHEKSPHGVVTISLGVATLIPDGDTSAETLLAQADSALYKSKEQGRNRVVMYTPENGREV